MLFCFVLFFFLLLCFKFLIIIKLPLSQPTRFSLTFSLLILPCSVGERVSCCVVLSCQIELNHDTLALQSDINAPISLPLSLEWSVPITCPGFGTRSSRSSLSLLISYVKNTSTALFCQASSLSTSLMVLHSPKREPNSIIFFPYKIPPRPFSWPQFFLKSTEVSCIHYHDGLDYEIFGY